MADVTINFTNHSATDFNLGDNGSSLTSFTDLNRSPGPVLAANSGSQAMAATQQLTSLEVSPYDIYCTWHPANSTARFGVKISVNTQIGLLGSEPSWFVSTDSEGGRDSEPVWKQSGGDPSSPYTWTDTMGFHIVATPTVDKTTLLVDVVINDLPSA